MPFISTSIALGTVIGASIGAGSAFTAAGAAIGAGVGAGAGIMAKKAFDGKGDKGSSGADSPTPMPQGPDASAIQDQAKQTGRKVAASQTRSVFTSPLGLTEEASVARKTLLGQ